MNADIASSARVIELCYETNRAIVRFEGLPPEIGSNAVFSAMSAAKPMARVNSEGFIVECGDLPLCPGMLLYGAAMPPSTIEARLLFELEGLVHFADGFGIYGEGPAAKELRKWIEGARAAIALTKRGELHSRDDQTDER
jgi:hypothetical protein